ncbi:KilA-N domain-containing protein [Brucellaceae bacterium D45D]
MNAPVTLTYNSQPISLKAEKLSLTDMWKADGADPSRSPSEWLSQEGAKRFLQFLADTMGIPETGKSRFGLVTVKKGGSARGETVAHWQVGLAYAKYLSPAFHMWCNTQVRSIMEGKQAGVSTGLTEQDRSVFGGMIKRGTGVVIREAIAPIEDALQQALHRIAHLEDKISSPSTCTAHDLWSSYGLRPIKGGTLWLGNRLASLGCLPEYGGRELIDGKWRRRFDAGRAHNQMKNGLLLLARQHVAERMGQGKLGL